MSIEENIEENTKALNTLNDSIRELIELRIIDIKNSNEGLIIKNAEKLPDFSEEYLKAKKKLGGLIKSGKLAKEDGKKVLTALGVESFSDIKTHDALEAVMSRIDDIVAS